MDVQKFRAIFIPIIVIITIISIVLIMYFRYGFSGFGMSSKKSIAVDEYSSIDINMDLGSVDIVRSGENYLVDVSFPANDQPTIVSKDGVLSIDYEGKAIGLFSASKYSITIYIPENADIIDSAKMDIDAGSINIEDVTFAELSISTDAGSVNIDNISSNKTSIKTNAGSINMENCETLGDVTLSADAGSVNIKKANSTSMDIKTDAGSVNIKNSNAGACSFVLNMGSLNFKGDFDSMTAKCDLGSINISCDNIEGKPVDVETSLGSVNVNGQSNGNSFRQ